jgi:hypothetical protein
MIGRTVRLPTLEFALHVASADGDGKTFVARDTPTPSAGATDDTDNVGEEFTVLVSRPPCAWEYGMVSKVIRHVSSSPSASRYPPRFSDAVLKSIPRPIAAAVYFDAAVTVFSRTEGYALNDVIAMHAAIGKPVDETLVMYYAIELLRIVGTVHAAGVAHCRLTAETVLIRNNDGGDGDDEDWSVEYVVMPTALNTRAHDVHTCCVGGWVGEWEL